MKLLPKTIPMVIVSILVIMCLTSCGSWLFPSPPVVVINASRTELQVNDTVTLTADINDASVGGLGEAYHFVNLQDRSAALPDKSRPRIDSIGGYFYVDVSQVLRFVSIAYQGNRVTAVFQAIQAGSTRVSIGVNGEVCQHFTPDARYGNRPGMDCVWNRLTFVSDELTIRVVEK